VNKTCPNLCFLFSRSNCISL